MAATPLQLFAASDLVVTLEKIIGDGLLADDPPREMKTREMIVKCCNAFEIPTIAERPAENSRPLHRKSEMFSDGEGSTISEV